MVGAVLADIIGHTACSGKCSGARRSGLNHMCWACRRVSMLSWSYSVLARLPLGRRRWHSGMLLLATNHSLIGIDPGGRHHHYVGNLLLLGLLILLWRWRSLLRIGSCTGGYTSVGSRSDIVVSILGL